MKNADKIIELLSEYLQKTDRMLDRMDANDKRLDQAYDVLMKQADELTAYRKRSEKLEERHIRWEEEMAGLKRESMKSDIRQESLMKEIMSLSKRVVDLEEE